MLAIDRIRIIEENWYRESPYFATFLLRLKFIENDDFPQLEINTLAVASIQNRITLIYNEEYLSKKTDTELEGLLYHEILHLTSLDFDRFKFHMKSMALKENQQLGYIWNVATDAVNNEDIIRTTIGERQLKLPEGEGIFMSNIREQGYNGLLIPEDIFDYLYKNNASCSAGGQGEIRGGADTTLNPHDNHSLLVEIIEDEEVMKEVEQIIKEARNKDWGTHKSSGVIKVDSFKRKKPVVDPRKIIHNHVEKFFFNNSGKYHNTWTRRNRRGFPLPGKRRAEPEVYVFMDVSGSTFSQCILQLFFNEIDYIIRRGMDIKLITWDTVIEEELDYKQNLWKSHQFKGGGGTNAQPIFDYLHAKNKSNYPIIIFTDGMFDWNNLNSKGIKPFWVFSQFPFEHHLREKRVPFGKSVVINNVD